MLLIDSEDMCNAKRTQVDSRAFLAEMKESFWGDLYGQTKAGLANGFSSWNRSTSETDFRGVGGMSERRNSAGCIAMAITNGTS
jgi:hypothetical protein